MTATNAYVEKLPMPTIGKPQKPRCFSESDTYPVEAQGKSWMSGELFEERLCELDQKCHHEGQKLDMTIAQHTLILRI